MSSNPPERPSLDGVITVQDIQQELNFIEHLTNVVSGTDDYLEAMVENQRLQLMAMLQQNSSAANVGLVTFGVVEPGADILDNYNVSVQPVPPSRLLTEQNLPLAAVGITNKQIYENDTGFATFQLGGTVFTELVRATEDIGPGVPVRVISPGNIVEAQPDVASSFIGLSGRISAGTFEVDETGENVSIPPGETETVLEVSVRDADWVFVGTNSETYSRYNYIVDGEDVLDDPLKAPLGVYNDPYKFPSPLSAGSEIEVEVTRSSQATAPAEYYSKVGYIE